MNSTKIAEVLAKVAQEHEVSVEDIKGRRGLREFVAARVAAAQELYQLGLTQREIAKPLNKSTAMVYEYLRKAWKP